jgi:hypothetical protein
MTLDQKVFPTILLEIDGFLSQGILPVHNGHLKDVCEAGDVLEYLLSMKKEGLISGDLITKGINNMPFRMTNIRLTYLGIRVLRS